MPAKDTYHDAVVVALQKEGWMVEEQYAFVFSDRRLYIDLRATRETQQRIIFVEIKTFQNLRSPLAYFQSALGQYLFYRTALKMMDVNAPLFLAISQEIFVTLFQEELIQAIVLEFDIKLLIFDPIVEEILEWKT